MYCIIIVCQDAEYVSKIFSILPHLDILDGEVTSLIKVRFDEIYLLCSRPLQIC